MLGEALGFGADEESDAVDVLVAERVREVGERGCGGICDERGDGEFVWPEPLEVVRPMVGLGPCGGECGAHGDADCFSVERIGGVGRDDDVVGVEGGGGSCDGAEVVVVVEVLEDGDDRGGVSWERADELRDGAEYGTVCEREAASVEVEASDGVDGCLVGDVDGDGFFFCVIDVARAGVGGGFGEEDGVWGEFGAVRKEGVEEESAFDEGEVVVAEECGVFGVVEGLDARVVGMVDTLRHGNSETIPVCGWLGGWGWGWGWFVGCGRLRGGG